MINPTKRCCWLLSAFFSFFAMAPVLTSAAPVMSEIYYHEPSPIGAEDIAAEWIEIYNPDAAEAVLTGWQISAGVEFLFPITSIPAGGYLIVAADPATFAANNPGAPPALGPWTGRLSNSGETIRLRDAAGLEIDQVDYADEGDWARRARGPLDRGHEGWTWEAQHDGAGMSLELINPSLTSNNGQNWSSSALAGGTPGSANSIAATDVAPLISNVTHTPGIPSASDPVTVEVELRDEAPLAGALVTLFWRLDGTPTFNPVPMGFDGTDRFSAQVPAQSDGAIVEFYVLADDGVNSRSWPAEVQGGGHFANALYQVDDSYDPLVVCAPGAQPTYYLIMSEGERAELEEIGTINNQSNSNAEMNCTYISSESSSTRVRYLATVRNRGASSRKGPPNNHLVKFRSDDAWEGLTSIKFNCQFVHSQVAGSWLYQWLGIETADSIPVQLRINGTDLSQPGGPRMYGAYARTESLDSKLTAEHWPLDPNGNLYQVRDDDVTGDEGDLKYEGTAPADYQNTYFKQTNGSEDDWSDLIALTDALNNSPVATYFEDVSAVLDIDQWLHFLAVDSLVGNREGGLTTGKGDDFALYRGVLDPRFKLVPHDLDTVLDQGTRGGSPNLSLFTYDQIDGLEEFLNHPDIVPLYYAKCLELLETRFKAERIDPIIDRAVAGFASANVVEEMKDFVTARRAGVVAQIPVSYSAGTDLPDSIEEYGRTTDGSVTFSGNFHAAFTRSVLVNGQSATLDARAGTWQLAVPEGGGLVLKPGLNCVSVTFHDGRDGTGALLRQEFLYVWNDTGFTAQVSGTLTGNPSQSTMRITTRDSYQPGVPFLVRVDFRNPDGAYARDVWETTATLSANVPGVLLTPNTIGVRNGLGTVLVSVGGAAGGTPVTVLSPGSVWSYLDDGADQGRAWRGVGFDDSGWSAGPAEFGYGDGDEDTEVSFGGNNQNKHATTYFRRTFQVDDASVLTGVDMRLKYDDGATVYINGTEFFRTSNMASNMAFDDYTVDGDDTPSENFQTFNGLSSALFVTGTNTVAVEIKQGDSTSSDISFDLELITQIAGSGPDPGDFTLTAMSGGQSVSKAVTSLTLAPPPVNVSGVLVGAISNWSGVVRITDDVTVPAGHVLNVAPGTLVLVDGDATPQSTAGKDIIVQGTINSLGTAAQPVTFTATDPTAIWGQILFEESEGASFTFTNIHRAGHSPRGGHTGHGSVLRILGSSVSFEDCNITDNRGKIGETGASGGVDSEMIFRRCHWGRSVMGIETFDTGVLVEDCFITDMLGIYREDGVIDDNDAIYLHGAGAGQSITLRRLTVAYMDDDGIDTLNADVVMEDVISRNCADKGASLFSEDVSIVRGLFVNNDTGISAKDAARVTLNHVTIAGNAVIGIQAENRDGNDAPSFYTIDNAIVWGNTDDIRTDYDPADITVAYSDIGETWSGVGNLSSDPLFENSAAGDFHLVEGSPAIGSGDPGGADLDMGFYPDRALGVEVRWAAANGPYRVTGDVTIPAELAFVIEPGTSVYFDAGTRLTVEGKVQIVGTPDRRIQFSHVPGSPLEADPAGNGGLPDAPPKWEGIKIVDSMDPDNLIAHVDVGSAQDSNGAIGIIRSQCVVDDVTFRDTHIRMFYTDDASIILKNSTFPDVFGPDQQAAALGLDNVSEQVKGVGSPPAGGRYIIQNNFFGTNKGHNDVIDVESGRRPGPIVQIIGNRFAGAGDELLDLGGDVYVADNVFYNVFKDDETSDRGYANAISTGDGGRGTTISVARNIFWDVDHAINLKVDTATIFENNTIYKIHPDFSDGFDNPSVASVVNLFIPTDSDPNATAGVGAYLSGNILADTPRVFSGADDDKRPPYPTTPLEMFDNLVDPDLVDASIGQNHPGQTVFDLGTGNVSAAPDYANPDAGDFTLLPGSPAIGAGTLGQDFGALVAEGIFITGEPPAVTSSSDATLTVGGPGIFAYRWRINGGPWSADLDIGNGFDPPAVTVRSAEIALNGLSDGMYTVEVEGQTFAGDWQPSPTGSKSWEVLSALPASVRINEVLAVNDRAFDNGGVFPDYLELYNPGTSDFDLGGYTISDDPAFPAKFAFVPGTMIPADGYLVLAADAGGLGFTLDRSGEEISLYQGAALVDSVAFGMQLTDLSVGRSGHDAQWFLNIPTPGAPNIAQQLGNPARVRISEWLVNGEVAFADEFVELHNPGPLPVDVGGMTFTDNPNSAPSAMLFPPLSFIAGTGYGVVFPDGFRLSAELDQIALFNSAGGLQDSVVYGVQTEDYSQGIGAGGGGYEQFRLPTPGLGVPEIGSPEEAAYNSAVSIFDSLRITEIMFNPPGGSDFEYIELRNIAGSPIDLAGTRFINGIGFTFPAMTLAPGEEVLVVGSLTHFEARYGGGLNVAGQFTGNLSNGGEGLTLQLPEPYEAAVLRLSYDDAWVVAADGEGAALQFIEPAQKVSAWRDGVGWIGSVYLGSPDGASLVLDTYTAWATREGVATENEDPDFDDITNLVEYALGTDPNVPNALPSLTMRDNGGFLEIDWAVLVDLRKTDLSLAFEMSQDAVTWTEGAPSRAELLPLHLSLTATFPISMEPRNFVRLVVRTQ